MNIPVSRSFRQFVLAKYPALSGSEPFLRLFHYLCFGSFFDTSTKRLVIPTTTIAELAGREPGDHHFNGQVALERLRAKVLPGLTWSGHEWQCANSYRGKAREILDPGFDAEMKTALHDEYLSASEDLVDFVTGQPYAPSNRYWERDAATAEHEKVLARIPLNATQAKILAYLRDLPYGHLFIRKLEKNREGIKAAIEVLPPEVRDVRWRILASVRRNPTVYYQPSARERTCRLSGRGDTILGLKSSVRKAVCAGWVECDLRSSQFAILASKLKAPISQAFVASGESIWRAFYEHTHGVNADPPPEIKKVFKEAMYSICFGKGVENLTWMLQENGQLKLLSHPIIQELLKLRKAWFERIRKDGGARDVWGRWQSLDHSIDPITKKTRRWAGSVAGSVIQSIEMEIIAPIFDVARKYGTSDQFTICLFQHDGATISFYSKEKTPRAQAKLKKAVEDRAAELGVSTVLEFTPL